MTDVRKQLKSMKLQRQNLKPVIQELIEKRHKEAKELIKQDIQKLKTDLKAKGQWINPFEDD